MVSSSSNAIAIMLEIPLPLSTSLLVTLEGLERIMHGDSVLAAHNYYSHVEHHCLSCS